jgi:type I restriction enzyme S subunit
MNSAWQEVELQDIANFQNGYAFKSDEYVPCSSNGKEVLRMGYIQRGGGFKEDGKPVYAPLSSRGNDRRYELDEGDIVIAMTDMKDRVAILGNCARIPSSNRFLLNQRVGKIRSKNNKVANQHFLYYYMNSPSQVHQLRSMANRGVQVNLTTASIIESLVFLPPIQHQEAIAHILGTLDDKIELNRKTNETLEAMAKALFKSWFVDFDPVSAKAEGRHTGLPAEISDLFPDSFEDSKLGEIPSGWRDGEIQDVADLNPENWGSRNQPIKIRYLDLASVKYGRTDNLEEYEWEDAPSRARRILKKGDTVVGTVRPGNGSYCLIGEDGITGSTGFAVLRPKARVDDAFVYLGSCSKDNIDRLAHLTDGGAYPAVRPELVAQTPVVIPSRQVLDHFSSYVSPLFANAGERERESKVLCHLRDTLLPKLISGEFRIPDAEKMLEEVGI